MCPNSPSESKLQAPKADENLECDKSKSQTLASQSSSSGVLLQTLQVYLRGRKGRHVIRALVDTGSQRSYISSKAVKLSKYQSLGEIPMVHSLFGGLESPQQKHRRFKVYLTSLDEKYNCDFEVLEQEKICGDIAKTPHGPWVTDLHKKGIKLTDCDNEFSFAVEPEIHLLIGADVAGKLLDGKIHYLPDGPVAVGTHLGWTLMGKIPQVPEITESYLSIISLLTGNINLPDMWNLDRIGILDPAESQNMKELHEAAYEHFQHSLKINDEGRYEITLPWLQLHTTLPDGKELAERRLKTTIRKLKTAGILEAYQNVLQNWLKNGIIEEVEKDDETKPGHYLPHRAVVKNSATTKIRPVFDASAHLKNYPSLNDCLAKGPNLLELIPAILTRFRMKEFAVVADIKQAFLQISVCEHDRNYLKFLWMEDGDHNKLKIYRHCRVVFGLTSSPFLLCATLKHHLENAPSCVKETASVLQDSFYVDNCLASFDSIEECETFVEQSKKLLLSGKFDLRGWQGNCYKLETSQVPNIPSTDAEKQDEGYNLISVLGLMWDVQKDVLSCNVPRHTSDNFQITKRKILAIVQQIYDPLGIICAFTLLPKILLQECWEQKISWDKELPVDITRKFLNWENQLNLLKDINIARWLMTNTLTLKHCSLHVFADASKNAYAVCIFLRVETEESVSCAFVRAKNRIAPLKTITIPRLELLACLIASRLAAEVKKDMKRPDIETFYWTDSSNALSWIKRDEQWAVFIANRVKEIRQLSNPDDWYHVPGNLNPADAPSRGSTIRYLMETKWLQGPTWLGFSKSEWPKSRITADEEVLNQERRKTVLVDTEKELPWYYRFSSYLKLVRVIAWMRRFLKNIKKPKLERCYSTLTVEEIEEAELMLLRSIQLEVFVSINNPVLKRLRPQLDEKGLIRVTTRLLQREDTDSFKHPIVLPSKHPVVHSLILEQHKRASHAGVHTLISQLRENFWILQCRRTIRQVLNKCISCRRFEATKAEVLPAPLPENRIKNAAAFEITGIDLGGPLYLRNGEKTWFVLFTCAVVRAVHLELVQSLTTETFCLAFRRFVSRRGRPLYVYSDNGTNLVGTSNILQNIDWQKVEEMASIKKIRWIFNPPTAAWWGGWWERLIGMTKRILRRVLGRARLSSDELTTILCEAENVINSRPLTYLSEDVEDLQPLTPSLFLQELRTGSIPEIDVFDSTHLNKRFRHRQKLKLELLKRFRVEYLGQLKHYSKCKAPTNLRVGQVVLIGSDNTKRIEWPMAKILELYPGKDNNTRVARVKTVNGELLRPYQRLFPLEVRGEERNVLPEKPLSNELDDSPSLTTDDDIDYSDDGFDSTKLLDHVKPEEDCPEQPRIRTRRGRVVRPTKKLDL